MINTNGFRFLKKLEKEVNKAEMYLSSPHLELKSIKSYLQITLFNSSSLISSGMGNWYAQKVNHDMYEIDS